MKTFGGKVLFLDRSDINTDEILPARYMNESSKAFLKPHLFEDLELSGFEAGKSTAGKTVVVTRANFGCGSSREHAPWALEQNGINMVLGESFARIFRQNMYNCGMIAAELPASAIDKLFVDFAGTGAEVSVDTEHETLVFTNGKTRQDLKFTLEGFERALVNAGGWVEYAAKRY
jgi:3-isopropylmalate/(R)-2-methylmalate dehydratase small subunit